MFQETFSKIGEAFIETLPSFIEIILVFIIGWYISKWIGQGIARFLEKTKINQIIKRVGWQESLAKMDISFNIPRTLGEFFRWCIFLLFLMAIAEIAQLPGVSQFLVQVISFLPNIFIALLIFLLALLAVDFSQKIVIGSLEKEKITYSKILGFSINEHTTENQFYILHRRNEIKRDNKNKFFKRDTFYLTRSGEKKINYLNKKY